MRPPPLERERRPTGNGTAQLEIINSSSPKDNRRLLATQGEWISIGEAVERVLHRLATSFTGGRR
jgi:hypothetical protein